MWDIIVFVIAALMSYWYETEIILFLGILFVMARFIYKWYHPIMSHWPQNRGRTGRLVLGGLPPAAFFMILYALLTMASFDVVGIWVVFYIIMGYAWLYGGLFLSEFCLGFSWQYDLIHLDNKAAAAPAAGCFMGLTLIYAGANIGDGPGWWVVLIAGGMGLTAWLCLALLMNLATRATERITVDRHVGCGIRFGAYLLASGLIFGRASGGDWTSFSATVTEFAVGWPALPLAVLFILVERVLSRHTRSGNGNKQMTSSVFWGCFYFAYAVIALMLLPGFAEGAYIPPVFS